MDEGGMMKALGEGWAGEAIAAVLVLVMGGVGGWFMRRPLEKAGIVEAVNGRIKDYMTHADGEIKRLTREVHGLVAARKRDQAHCDEELAAMRAEIAAVMASTRVATYPHDGAE